MGRKKIQETKRRERKLNPDKKNQKNQRIKQKKKSRKGRRENTSKKERQRGRRTLYQPPPPPSGFFFLAFLLRSQSLPPSDTFHSLISTPRSCNSSSRKSTSQGEHHCAQPPHPHTQKKKHSVSPSPSTIMFFSGVARRNPRLLFPHRLHN
jgi:hypothetical protein